MTIGNLSTRILPESARWLITLGKKKEATKEIMRAAKINGRQVPEDLLDTVSSLKHTCAWTKIKHDQALK